jgi:hypothetical protein
LQVLYIDDANRALKYITDDTQPEISITISKLQEYLKQKKTVNGLKIILTG